MQARRRAQPSGTNSPSSSHPRLKHRARCAIFIRARHAAARVAPARGDLAGSNTKEPRGSAPRERDHRGGDHPVPSRTRQLSPPSPRVLQREAAGGQGVALAEGAFLSAPRRPAGGSPLRAFLRFGEVTASRAALRAMPAGLCVVRPRHGSRARPQGALRAVTLAESICVLGTLMPSSVRFTPDLGSVLSKVRMLRLLLPNCV